MKRSFVTRALVSMLFIFAFALSCGGGGSSGGSSDDPFSGQSGDFFVATVESADNTIEFNAVSVNTGIGFCLQDQRVTIMKRFEKKPKPSTFLNAWGRQTIKRNYPL